MAAGWEEATKNDLSQIVLQARDGCQLTVRILKLLCMVSWLTHLGQRQLSLLKVSVGLAGFA